MEQNSDNPMRAAKTARQSAGIFGQVSTVEAQDREPAEAPPEEVEEDQEYVEDGQMMADEDPDPEFEEADDVEEPEESLEPGDTYIVRVDGEEVEVTLDELLSGYSRTSDYTRKTQALAEQRKQFEQERQQALSLAQTLEQRLAEAENFLSQADEKPNWTELAKTMSPQEYNAARAQWDAQQEQIRTVKAQRDELRRMQAEEQRRQMEEAARRGQEQLPKLIPEWQDPEKARTEAEAITQWAISEGFSQEALDNLIDPLAVKVLRDAWRFNNAMSQKPKVVKKKAPKTARAGKGVPNKKRSALEKQINTPGKPRDKIDFFKTIQPIR